MKGEQKSAKEDGSIGMGGTKGGENNGWSH